MVTMGMVIVAGHLIVDPDERERVPRGLPRGRRAGATDRRLPRLLDRADLVDPGRINVYERWESTDAVEAFRGDGPSTEQQAAAIRSASVAEYGAVEERVLTD